MKNQKIVATPKIKADTVCHIIMDMSGSMAGLASATREGLNNYLRTLKEDKNDDTVLVSVTVFDSSGWYGDDIVVHIDTVINMLELDKVPEITESHYKPRGGTPMYDAIGTGVERTERALENIEGNPEVLLVIITDGEENTSKTFKQGQIKALLETKEGQGWSTVYLGANQDAWEVGSSLGINAGNVKSYAASEDGITNEVFGAVAGATVSYRSMKSKAKIAGVGDGYTTKSFFSQDGGLVEKEE